MGDAIIATDPEGIISYWNKTAENIFKWQSEEIIGKNIIDAIFSKHSPKQAQEIISELKGGRSWEGEIEVKDKNGRIFLIHVADYPLTDKHEQIMGCTWVIRHHVNLEIFSLGNEIQGAREDADQDYEEAQNDSAFLSNAALELIHFKTPKEVFVYTVNKLYQLFNRRVIITGVEYDNPNNRWKMHEVKGINSFVDNSLKKIGINLRKMEGEINTRFLPDVKKGKYVELAFDLNSLTNGKISGRLNEVVKKLIPIKKVLVIPIKREETIYGTITLLITRSSTNILKRLTETFITQISVFVEKLLIESELRANEKKLTAAEKIAHIGNYEIDLPTNTALWSEETYRIFGLEYQKGKEIPVSEYEGFIHPADRLEMKERFKQALSEEASTFHQAYRIVRPDKEVRYVQDSGEFEFDEKGSPVKLFGTLQDITLQKKFESELMEAKQKAEESDRLKSAFLANMSHEIRTPMNGILGFTHLLQQPDITPEKTQNYLAIIQKSGNRMLNTINDIIEISRIETGQVDVSRNEVNISAQLDFIYHFFVHEAEKKGIQLVLNNSLPEEKTTVLTDGYKLESILINLVKNALKYSDEGTIQLSCSKVEEQLMFAVRDTGQGIPENRLEAIFERFVQADIEDRYATEGSGLGLAIVKAYVEMLGGNIWVESEIGKGSVFYFTIEYVRADAADSTIESDTKISTLSQKEASILIAEDDEVSNTLFKTMLSSRNFRLTLVNNGADAIQACQQNPDLDLILMDLKMPGVDGIQATKKIREFNKEIPIIAQTAFAFIGDKERALDAGCNEYITKPIKQESFIELINKYT